MAKLFRRPWFLLTALTLVGALLRFLGIAWGSPWWFHPDERNVASAVVSLHWSDQMDPHFFAYGTVPIYLNFFLVQLLKPLFPDTDPFAIAVLVGRFWSALLSTSLIPLMYWIVKKYFFHSSRASLSPSPYPLAPILAALLTTFTTGFIQYAHFGTFEIWLTFFYLLFFVSTIELAHTSSFAWLVVTSVIFGLAIGTKVTSLILLPVFLLALLWRLRSKKSSGYRLALIRLINLVCQLIIFILIAGLVFFLTNPYTLNLKTPFQNLSTHDLKSSILSHLNPEFLHSINVEGGIARGDIPVFYTRQFTGSLPVIFHLRYVYPWALSWPVTLLGLIGLIWMTIFSLTRRSHPKNWYVICVMCSMFFLLQFVFNSTLYVKWLRYTIPTLPFLILGASWFLAKIQHLRNQAILVRRSRSEGGKQSHRVFSFLCFFVLLLAVSWHILQGLLFFTIYLQPDSRIAAAQWLSQHYPNPPPILSEVWDIGIVPANPHFADIELFNFYELDDPALTAERLPELQTKLDHAKLFIVLSRRLWKNSLDHSSAYPQAAKFYESLFSDQLSFTKVAEFSNAPRLGPLVIPTELLAEETFSAFDHPTIQVWEKQP